MGKFSTNTVKIEMLPEGKAKLLEDFSYENDRFKVTAKAGFVFDGASIPKFFWRVIGHPFSFKLLRPAIIHDVCYASEYFEREYADELFEEMLDRSGVSELKENAMFMAVRIGGGSVWEEHTEQSIMDALKFIEVKEK
jgi:hypothetical protein